MRGTDRLLYRLEWRVVRRLDGRVQGGYHTPRRGSGLDFAGLRPYVEGDDARHIDWNVTARLDEPQVREFNEDRELTTWLVLDRSASMAVGGAGRGKQDVLVELALILARMLGRNGNRVGAILYDGALRAKRAGAMTADAGTTRIVPPSTGRGHALRIGRELDRAADSWAAATTDLAAMRDTVAALPGSGDLGLHRHRGVATSAHPARPPKRRRGVAGGRPCGRSSPRGRSDRGRGRGDARAAPRRLRRPVVPRPVPRRGRRARGRTSLWHAPGRGAVAPGRHRQ